MDAQHCWPLAINRIRRGSITNSFGMVRHDAAGRLRPHQGWDFAAAIGTPCFAVADGHVALTAHGGAYGNLIAIAFDLDDRTCFAAYAHLSEIEVAEGQPVKRGQQIGRTGDSGNAHGMALPDQHLHFELRMEARPGRGLAGRRSPLALFRTIPLDHAIAAACPLPTMAP